MNFATFFEFFEEADIDYDFDSPEISAPEYCSEVDNYLMEENSVQAFFALDRMSNEVNGVNIEEVEEYLSTKEFNPIQFQGLMNNWKGVYGEIEALEYLNESGTEGISYKIPSFTNNPGVDIYGVDSEGEIVEQYQVKMSLDSSYLQKTINELPDSVKLICPTEIASQFNSDQVVDLGLSLESVEEELGTICEVIEEKEPWEKALDSDFFNWLESSRVG